MSRITQLSISVILGLTLILAAIYQASARPIADQTDPLRAVASEHGLDTVVQTASPKSASYYYTYQPQSEASQEQVQHERVVVEPEKVYPSVEVTKHESEQPHTNVGSNEQNVRYVEEIIYVDQDGVPLDPQPSSQPDITNKQEAANQRSGPLTDVSATILAEIPIRDLTPEVLQNLKNEYGVRVVATREYPGGNLMINCDEYLNKENTICARPTELDMAQPHQTIPETHHELAEEVRGQPQPTGGQPNELPTTEPTVSPTPVTYDTRQEAHPEIHSNGQLEPIDVGDNQSMNGQNYGQRSTYVTDSPQTTAQTERPETQSLSDSQSGFGENQPASSPGDGSTYEAQPNTEESSKHETRQ